MGRVSLSPRLLCTRPKARWAPDERLAFAPQRSERPISWRPPFRPDEPLPETRRRHHRSDRRAVRGRWARARLRFGAWVLDLARLHAGQALPSRHDPLDDRVLAPRARARGDHADIRLRGRRAPN